MPRYARPLRPPAQQRGMALIVCLIMLLLLTMVGVSSMQNATLQEKMAGSVKFRNESFQAAELALRVGENAVAASSFVLGPCADENCLPPPATDYGARTTAGSGSRNITWVAAGTSLYGVQNIGTTTAPVNPPTGCTSQSTTLYRITAIGFSGTSRSVVESVYGKC